MIEVESVLPGGTAARHGIQPGDRLLSINGQEIRDSIDFHFLAADDRLALVLKRKDGSLRRIRMTKDPDDTLGIAFPPLTVRRCRNKCLFCFVDQMPSGCRPSLSVKDDDYRASFLFGNYITLGNLRDGDWERIFSQRLSPLYVSVHATQPGLRRSILNNQNAPDIMDGLRRLADGGIGIHTQIVLCPGINDGQFLVRTVNDLATLAPAVRSIAVVPVGLTKHRKGLFPLRRYSTGGARAVVETLLKMGSGFRRRFGTRLVFPSDEFFIQADQPFPPARFYEDFPQIENGVGMVADFLRGVRRTRLPARIEPVRATIVTGRSFAPILTGTLSRLRAVEGLSVRVLPVRNDLFGPSVTVAGLLSGRDIIRTIRGKRLGDVLLLPANALKDDGRTFIDDRTVQDIERSVAVPVQPVLNFRDVVSALRSFGRKRGQ